MGGYISRNSYFFALLIGGGLISDFFTAGREQARFDAEIAEFLVLLVGIPAVIALVCALVSAARAASVQKSSRMPLVTSGIALGLVVALLLTTVVVQSPPRARRHPSKFRCQRMCRWMWGVS